MLIRPEFFTSLLTILLVCPFHSFAQSADDPGPKTVMVDGQGIMRWTADNTEVKGFGVNYTVPFAHACRSAKKLGVDPLTAIEQDVYHFSRLGFDLYRVHVWDTEISDTLGNLVYNEHFHAFDFLLKTLARHGINYVLTPIAFWGNGWPEPDLPTPGFSHKYGKGDCLTDPDAIAAQENYLTQFLSHVNPYTGIAYKDDPRLIAVEISNEPHHREAPDKVTEFIERMVRAVRKSGYTNPVFYNVSHSVHLAEHYFAAGIDGGTFQWYPTGLGFQHELPGNFLPNVDRYLIPFDDVIKKHSGAKLVYEFDAPDIGKSYIYPAMARSFRSAGIQVATHFSYDPTYLAYANTEYNTHYMNLAYTPGKALALMIASEVFHRVPMYADFGRYPDNTAFDGFSVSFEKDLAMLNHEDKFYYTNHTETPPVSPSSLSHVAGVGNSPVIRYDGTGAYFLDRLENGIWRLEVMPDALITGNPYGRNSLDKTVAVIQWNTRSMQVNLNELGQGFDIEPLNPGNTHAPAVDGRAFNIRPGTYLLRARGNQADYDPDAPWRGSVLGDFAAPATTVEKTYLIHQQPDFCVAGQKLAISTEVLGPDSIRNVTLLLRAGFRGKRIKMTKGHGFTYHAEIPPDDVKEGFLDYYLLVATDSKTLTWPAGMAGRPFDWDFYERTPYSVGVTGPGQPVSLFNAGEDAGDLSMSWWSRANRLVPSGEPSRAEYQVRLETLYRQDPENLNAPHIHDFTIRHFIQPDRIPHAHALESKTWLVLEARSLGSEPAIVQVALTTLDGSAYGKAVRLDPGLDEYRIPLEALEPVPLVTMPRPYPTFLPYYFEPSGSIPFKVEHISGIQLSIGPGLNKDAQEQGYSIGIVRAWLE